MEQCLISRFTIERWNCAWWLLMEECLMVEDGAEMPIFSAAAFRCLRCQCIYVYHASTRRWLILSCINPFESFISFHLPRKAQRQTQCQSLIHLVICDFVAILTILDISRNSDNEIGYSDSWKVTMGKVWLCHISKLLCTIQGYWSIGCNSYSAASSATLKFSLSATIETLPKWTPPPLRLWFILHKCLACLLAKAGDKTLKLFATHSS